MKITFTGQQIDVGDVLRLHVKSSIDATVEKHFSDIINTDTGFSTKSFHNSKQNSPGAVCRRNEGNTGWINMPETEA